MNICICSNDKILVDKLKLFLEDFFHEKDTNFKTTHIYSLDNINKNNLFDVILLDLTKNTVNENIKKTPIIYITDVIFYTLNSVNYENILLKPIKYSSFNKEFSIIFFRYLETLNKSKSFILEKINNFSLSNKSSKNFNTYNKNINSNIKSSSIIYVENISKNNSKIFTDTNCFEIDENIDFFEKNFSSNFFRCNKSHLINLNKLSKIGKYFVIINSQKIDVDKDRFKKLKDTVVDIFQIKF